MARKSMRGHVLESEESVAQPTDGNGRKLALEKLEQLVLEGLRHGFFECSVVCEVLNGKKRRLVIKAGVSHQFIILPNELDGAL